ncbi:MAG: DNA repair protein RadA [Anaerolineae bacterium]|nr:DNA repair protein RadA [Anaerolineae bacterium]
MAKTETRWICQECGWSFIKEMGKCPHCSAWDSLKEMVVRDELPAMSVGGRVGSDSPHPTPLSQVDMAGHTRIPVANGEFARVLGGGLVPGSIVLIGGEPGIGKSTLLLQIAAVLGDAQHPVLYVSGEESPGQLKRRAARLEILGDTIQVLAETNVDFVLQQADRLPTLQALIVDSIQTTHTGDLNSAAGSVSQVRECASRFQRWAKRRNIPVFLVGHVTKSGLIAGPKVLEHIVDTVLYLEGDPFHTYRLLRSIKNRFGATSEVGVFEMCENGLIEVENPSESFLAERMVNVAGSAIAVTMEGTRPLLVEIQGLANTTSFANPRRTVNGLEFNRLLLVVAVLSRRVGLRISDQDIFANVVGGLQIEEPAADLAVAAALASSVRDRPVAADLALVGEIGLSGELRSVGRLEARLKEAARLGFQTVVVPRNLRREKLRTPAGLNVVAVRTVSEALEVALT